ncbi:hypothetical protein [Chryseobacterium sp. 2R14A]|uniref:hypothetical protein n=1 Tax=Chryseobacterium sp. 2R14A TaxID=3380353 RepID=UPI003CEA505B
METKFISEFGEQDLSKVKYSIQESNPRVADTMFTKFTLPYECYADEKYIKMFGDYTSYESNNLKNKITGLLQIENKIHDATKYIQGNVGKKMTEQIDYGFEELPNFDKKLSELPLDSFDVPDIHIYAKEIAAKTWPETNFNFPRIYTKKYPASQEMWSSFDGYYNHLKPDGSEMFRNETDSQGNIFNRNIIHPMPHPIYVLIKGFEDAGFELEGDILTDPVLQKKWIFSGTEYFSKINQFSNLQVVSSNEYVSSDWRYNVVLNTQQLFLTYEKTDNLPFQDKVYVNGKFSVKINSTTQVKFIIQLNGVEIWSYQETVYQYSEITKPFSLEINVNNSNLKFYVEGSLVSLDSAYEVISYELKSNSIINSTDQTEGYDNSMVDNKNKIDLKKAVPDMTFGEYFNRFKNWFNYDLDIIDKRAIMNKLATKEISNVKDFTKYEVSEDQLKRNFLNKRSFLLKFSELDDDAKKDSIYFDIDGQKINGEGNEETIETEIDGYVMPVKLPKENGYNTAFVLKDSSTTLALVDYDGLKNGQNNANSVSDCDFPDLFETHHKPWLKLRLNGQEFIWPTYANIEQFSNYGIKDFIYAYNNVHIIQSWTKNKISDNIYQVEMTTETIS